LAAAAFLAALGTLRLFPLAASAIMFPEKVAIFFCTNYISPAT
jgi:hypothetical protein